MKFGFPRKLIRLTKLCMENTQYTVRVDKTMSTPFTVNTGLKQGDTLSPILFNLVLEKVGRELQCLRSSHKQWLQQWPTYTRFRRRPGYYRKLIYRNSKYFKGIGESCGKSRSNNKHKKIFKM